jgi:hypothetical protein
MDFKSLLAGTFIGMAIFMPCQTPQSTSTVSSQQEDTLCEDYWVYSRNASIVLAKYKSNITAKMLADAWWHTREEYGVEVPLKLALAQAQMESMFGTTRLTVKNKNPYNIVGKGGFVKYQTVNKGVRAYYRIIANQYLKCKTVDQLMKQFTNCSGHRYAEYEGYEQMIDSQMTYYERKFGY